MMRSQSRAYPRAWKGSLSNRVTVRPRRETGPAVIQSGIGQVQSHSISPQWVSQMRRYGVQASTPLSRASTQEQLPRGRRRPDRAMARRLWGEMQQQMALQGQDIQPASVTELIDFLWTLTGARNPSTLSLSQKAILDGKQYRLSYNDFDLKGKAREVSLRPVAPATTQDNATIESIFNFLVESHSDGITSITASQWQEIIQLRLFACFSLLSPKRGSQTALSILRKAIQSGTEWRLEAETLQMLVNLTRAGHDHQLGALLVALTRRTMKQNQASLQSDSAFAQAVADLCVCQLTSPIHMDRQRARTLLQLYFSSSPGARGQLEDLPPVMVAGLLYGLVRMDDKGVEGRQIHILASILDKYVMSMSPNIHDPQAQFCIVALATERALMHTFSNIANPDLKPLKHWVMRLMSRGHLRDHTTSSAVHSVLLRARSRRVDLCETEPEIKSFVLNTTQQYFDLPAGFSSWGWAIRVLMGRSSSLIRPASRKRRANLEAKTSSVSGSESGVNLMQAYEASLLLDAVIQLPGLSNPTPFLCLPLLESLMVQFPPQIEKCMSIYRSMRTQDSRSRWFSKRLAFLDSLRGEQDSTHQGSNHGRGRGNSRNSRMHAGPDQRTLTVLLDGLFACDLVEVDSIKEIIKDLTGSQPYREHLLRTDQRVRYAAMLLPLLEEEEAADVWSSFVDPNDDGKAAAWCSDWTSQHWKLLIEHLSGLGDTLCTTTIIDSTRARSTWSNHLNAPLRVSLPLLLRTISAAIKSQEMPSRDFFTAILHKIGHMAVVGFQMEQDGNDVWSCTRHEEQDRRESSFVQPHPSPSSCLEAVEVMHDFTIQDRSLEPDLPLLNALMNAYSRCRHPVQVYEIWDALAIASVSSHGSHLSGNKDDQGAAIDGATISALLDTAGRFGPEERGRRAWRFSGRLDDELVEMVERRLENHTELDTQTAKRALAHRHALPYFVRNKNAWDSWLEFLCRSDCLSEAVQELDVMKTQHEKYRMLDTKLATKFLVKPDHKTLGMLLKFCAKERDWSQDEVSLRKESQSNQSERMQSSLWSILRGRVEDGEFGPDIWEQVKDVGMERV